MARANSIKTRNQREIATRFGGELPLGCDALRPVPRALPDNVLLFSHGRAALLWLIARRGPFASAALSAYTCPSVPRCLEAGGLALDYFDHGESDPLPMIRRLPKPWLVLVPAPFGSAPWLDVAALARVLGAGACVVIDAAQTAFGFEDFSPPPGGAVLACPRKALAIGDGAVLRLDGLREDEQASVAALPMASAAAAQKQAARVLFATGNIAREAEALALARAAEVALPSSPHQISIESRDLLHRADPVAHAHQRRTNAQVLRAALEKRASCMLGGAGTPFNFPIVVDDRDAVLKRLHERRVFATALWPDARHDPARHPMAARLARQLLALPIDQRYDAADMARLAGLVGPCL